RRAAPLPARADERLGERAAEDLVDELEPGTTRERLDLEVADRVLTVATRLLDVATDALARTSDGLAVRDLGRGRGHLDSELAFHPFYLHVQVGLAHPVHHGLVRLVRALDAERRVLLTQARERGRELVLVALGLRRDREREQRFGHLDGRQRHRVVLGRERV